MTLKKKVFPVLILCTFILSSFSVNFGIFADNADDFPVNYVTEKSDVKATVNAFVEDKHFEVKLNKIQGDSEISEDNKVLWIDDSLIHNPKAKGKLTSLYNNGCKIIIRKDDLTEQEVLTYFGLDSKGLAFDNMTNKSDLKRVGIFLQKESVKWFV